ncbi:MAG: sugar transferase [Firmicutes bacterium]|nr:sugar transferase [Bacillota bacterium]
MDLRRKNKFIMVTEVFANILGMGLLFLLIWFIFYRYNLTSFLYKKGTALLVLIYCAIYLLFNQIYRGFKIDYLRKSEIVYSQCLSMMFVNIITFFQICLIDRRVVAIPPMVILSAIDVVFILCWTLWSKKRYRKRSIVRDVVIIYRDKEPWEAAEKINHYDDKFNVSKFIKCDCSVNKILKKLSAENGVVLCGIDPTMRKTIMDFCFERSMPVFVIPDSSDIILKSAAVLSMQDMPLFQCHRGELNLIDEFVKRAFDICASLLGIIFLSPIMALTALAVKLCDNGPVFYKQERLTLNGHKFKLYKFRSMIVDAEKDGVARLAQSGDSRITPVGHVIRKFRLDELPQLFNILFGDISVVGPRPERPEISKQYEKSIPEFKFRLKMKAGLTGYAQVIGRYNTTPYDKLMWDLMYIENYSFMMDLKIILMTIKILFLPESTQGVGEGLMTAEKTKEASR